MSFDEQLSTTPRIAIVGNSGSGKSTLARRIAARTAAPVLDLDTLVWEPERIAVMRAPEAARRDLEKFCAERPGWIVEGCYAGLIESSLRWKPLLIFLNPGEAACLRNCRHRPWEPHKYANRAEQDARLAMLLEWVSAYYVRDDDMSLARHRVLFEGYSGPKREIGDD